MLLQAPAPGIRSGDPYHRRQERASGTVTVEGWHGRVAMAMACQAKTRLFFRRSAAKPHTVYPYIFPFVCLFAWLIQRTFSAKKRCFPLTANQQTVLFSLTFQQNEHDWPNGWPGPSPKKARPGYTGPGTALWATRPCQRGPRASSSGQTRPCVPFFGPSRLEKLGTCIKPGQPAAQK